MRKILRCAQDDKKKSAQDDKLRNLARAARVTKDIYGRIAKLVRAGARESEIARKIEALIKEKGLKRSFRTIVASGPNAARPHAKPTKRIIKTGDAVVVDFGVLYNGYHSDMTRTIILGRNPKTRKLYNAVKTAQKMAFKKIAPGLKISELAGRIHGYLRKKGFGKYILHSLGHGIGVKIHEAPKLSEKNKKTFGKNMVVTIEPGLYIKGACGVRIEDMVLVTRRGARVLTR